MDRAAGRKLRRVPPGDQVDRDHVGDERDVGMLERRRFQRLLDRRAGRVGDMNDPAMAVTAFAGQVQRAAFGGERHAQFDQPLDRRGRASTTCSTTSGSLRPAPAIIVSLMWASKLSPSSSTAAIPPCAQPVAPSPSAPLAMTATLRVLGEVQRGGQPGRAGADDEDVRGGCSRRLFACTRLRKTSSRSGSRVRTSTIENPSRCTAASTSPALHLSLR